MATLPKGEPSARQASLSDADELARLRWVWRAVERDEQGDWDRFRADFVAWVAEHEQTHFPYLVEIDGCPVAMAWLVIIERVPGLEKWTRLSGMCRACTSLSNIATAASEAY